MTNNALEVLIAKGRRVHHARDQREVAFGLADLTTNLDLHERIVKKGGIQTLTRLLSESQDIETQRFAALAIANTARTDKYRVDILQQDSEDRLTRYLIDYVGDEEKDLLGRQYCAMAIGNLAAESDNHTIIADLKGLDALVLLLKLGVKENDLESRRYAAFALSNFTTSEVHRKIIAEIEGVVGALVLVACSDDLAVQRQGLAALRGICISSNLRSMVIQAGILDPLILMARSEDVEVLREVATTIDCLSSVSEHKKEVGDRAIAVIVSLLLSGDQTTEYHACSAIANLAELEDVHSRLLDENGLPSVVSMFASNNLICKGEAARAIANLSANADNHSKLQHNNILDVLVETLSDNDVNCQRFAALGLANLATTVASQISIVQAGALRPLVHLVMEHNGQVEARRYAALALAHLSATNANHGAMFKEACLEALYALSNSSDTSSQMYVGCALANLGSDAANHHVIVEEGGIQPLIMLVYSKNANVHFQAVSALRGLSATATIKTKLVQEGAIEPISRLLLSSDPTLLREACACFCNLSLSDENKTEMGKSGIIPPLISLMESEDMEISALCCACLANLAELSHNQEIIVSGAATKVCIVTMRSRSVEVQTESGRLLANLCACDMDGHTDEVMESGGHHLLISFLLSRKASCQRIGAFGIGNLCTYERHRVALKDARALEPLCTLIRSDDVNSEIQEFAMLAMVNLSDEVKNHQTFMQERIFSTMISLSNTKDPKIRQYAAISVANIARNMELRDIATEEGGLEPVLYLARTDHTGICRIVLPSLSTLSFVEKNKEDICTNGGILAILRGLKLGLNCDDCNDDAAISACRSACCTVANLCEERENMKILVDACILPMLVQVLDKYGDRQPRLVGEAVRALGNFATNLDYGEIIMKNKGIEIGLVALLGHGTTHCRRAASVVLSNIAANNTYHSRILDADIMNPLQIEFHNSLDPKIESDHEVTRCCLILLANLCTCHRFHDVIVEKSWDLLMKFSGHRDIRCRQNAVIVLGNLSSCLENTISLSATRVVPLMISFAFHPVEIDPSNAQYQAIAGLRGLAMNDDFRVSLVTEGCCEPLILASGEKDGKVLDIGVLREAAAAIYNLALCNKKTLVIAQSGIVAALVNLMRKDDIETQVFAIGALANLAQCGAEVQSRLLSDGCLTPLVEIVSTTDAAWETKQEVTRCMALFANETESHEYMMRHDPLRCLMYLMSKEKSINVSCRRFAVLAVANLASSPVNCGRLLNLEVLSGLQSLLGIDDVQTLQCVAFALHNICKCKESHLECEERNVSKMLCFLLDVDDNFTKLHASLALKYLSTSRRSAIKFMDQKGLPKILHLATYGEEESKLEAAASLRNLLLLDENRGRFLDGGGLAVLATLARSRDHLMCHHACGALANLAELPANQTKMIDAGILHHLKFALRSNSPEVVREALRTICNLSSDFSCTNFIANSGLLLPLVGCVSSKEMLSKRFAAMAIANLGTNSTIQPRLVEEGVLEPLLFLASVENDEDNLSRLYSLYALCNISAYNGHHPTMIQCGVIGICCSFMKSSSKELVLTAALCLANLASDVGNHEDLRQSECLHLLLPFLSNCNERQMQLRTVSFLRGLSASRSMREILIINGVVKDLLKLVTIEDVEIQIGVLASLCNLSISGDCIGHNPFKVLDNICYEELVSFLCSSNSTYSIFGALGLGNIASDARLQEYIASGTLQLIDTANKRNLEAQRCIAYTLCNLCNRDINRRKVVQNGGLPVIYSMALSKNETDAHVAISTLRGIASLQEFRNEIVQTGGLEPLMDAIKRTALIEISCEAICWLSLDNRGKTSIVGHTSISILINLTTDDNDIISYACFRTLSNCSERTSVQKNLLKKIPSDFIRNHIINYQERKHIAWELSRLLSNLCTHKSNHSALFSKDILELLLDLNDRHHQSIGNPVTYHVILCIMNLSTSLENHKKMNKYRQQICCLLLKQLSLQFHQSDDMTKAKCEFETKDRFLKTRRFACLAIGCLLKCDEFYAILLDKKVVGILQGVLLGERSLESMFNASFVLHQVIMTNSERRTLALNSCFGLGFERIMLDLISNNISALRVHAISTLRYFTLNEEIAVQIATKSGLSSMANAATDTDINPTCNSTSILREFAATLNHLSSYAQNKLTIVNAEIFECILLSCESRDNECARFALAALANCMEDEESQLLVFRSSDDANRSISINIIQMLIKTMAIKTLPLKREASRAVSNILSCNEAMQFFIENNGLRCLESLSTSIDYECQSNIALSLRKLASCMSNHEVMMANKLLPPILHLCQLQNNELSARHSITAFKDLASNRHMKEFIANEGGIAVAIELLKSSVKYVCITTAASLHHLSNFWSIRKAMCDEGVLISLCHCITRIQDEKLLYHGASILSNLAEHDEVRYLLWSKSILSAITTLASAVEVEDVHEQVTKCICFMVTSNISKTIERGPNPDELKYLEVQLMKIAINLLSSKSPKVAQNAALAVGNFAKDASRQELLCRQHIYAPLVHLIKIGGGADTNLNKFCFVSPCWALSRIMIPVKNKVLGAKDGYLLQRLIQLKKSLKESSRADLTKIRSISFALCNISACKDSHADILSFGGVTILLSLLSLRDIDEDTFGSCIKCLCNLCFSQALRAQIIFENGILLLLQMLDRGPPASNHKDIIMATLGNIAMGAECGSFISTSGAVQTLCKFITNTETSPQTQISSALILYNLSTTEHCHKALIDVIGFIIQSCSSACGLIKRYSMMTLSNISINERTRLMITKNGGLQTSIVMLKDSDLRCRIYACLCLANLTNDINLQNQAVQHGALTILTSHLRDSNGLLVKSALLCTLNILANSSNHKIFVDKGAINSIYQLFSMHVTEKRLGLKVDIEMYGTFIMCNLLTNQSLLETLGTSRCILALLNLAASDTFHCKCIALNSLCHLAELPQNRPALINHDISNILTASGLIPEANIQAEVAACICNLSKDVSNRKTITTFGISTLINLLQVFDTPTLSFTAAALANLAEDEGCLRVIIDHGATRLLAILLNHKCPDVYCEVARAVSNLLSSTDVHDFIVGNGLTSLLGMCRNINENCRQYASLGCRKIVVSSRSHPILMKAGLPNLLRLLQFDDLVTVKHTLATLRDMSSNPKNSWDLVERGTVQSLAPLVDNRDSKVQELAMAILRNLSSVYELKRSVLFDEIILKVTSSIFGATDKLLTQTAGLLANLSQLDGNRAEMIDAGVVPALIVLSRKGATEIIQNVSRTLANLSAEFNAQFEIYEQGGMVCLFQLINVEDAITSRYVNMALELLISNMSVRKQIVDSRELGAIYSLSDHGSIEYRRSAAIALSLFSSDETCRLDLITEALPPILTLCKSSDLPTLRGALHTIANISNSCETHKILLDGEGIVLFTITGIADQCSDFMVVREITRFFASISINDPAKDHILHHGVLPKLTKYSRRTDSATQRYSILALCNVCMAKNKTSSLYSDETMRILIFLSRCCDIEVERCSFLSMAALASGARSRNKEALADAGVLYPILKAMKYPDYEMKHCSSLALNSLLLSNVHMTKVKVKNVQEELNSTFSLLSESATDDESIHNEVYAIGSMIENAEVRQTLVDLGCLESIAKVSSSASIEVRRACGYVYFTIAKIATLHKQVYTSGALREIVNLAGLVDLECQLYAACALVYLARNYNLQVPLVKMGVVRHLVSMMATESDSRHYAASALLELAENYETHIKLAEEGGIQALLKLGRNGVADNGGTYRTIGKLASHAIATRFS